jgi:hypothetical protein
MADLFQVDPKPSVWSLLALNDSDLERVDLVILNLAVARGIESQKDLDVQRYVSVVDGWTNKFRQFLPGAEYRMFHRAPERFHNDIHFFRTGMLAKFLGSTIGIAYIEEQRDQKYVRYVNPSDLLLNGLIDTKRGNCCTLAQIHVAISRRMGWPVSLCSVYYHWLSRFDNGKSVHTIETSKIDAEGHVGSSPDEWYIRKFEIPPKAIECGSEMRSLTAREMIGAFLACRGRHYADIRRHDLADVTFALARHLFPNHRQTYARALDAAMLSRGRTLFEQGEKHHTDSVFHGLEGDAETIQARKRPPAIVNYAEPLITSYAEVTGAYGCFSPIRPKTNIN